MDQLRKRLGFVPGPSTGFLARAGGFATQVSVGADTSTTMTLGITDSPDPRTGGGNITYTVTPTNTGANAATTVSIAVTLDSSLTFVSAVGTGWTCGAVGQVVTCTRASMPTGAAITIAIVATTANADATVSTSGVMTADNAPTANSGADTTTVVGQTTMTLALADSPDPIMGGKNLTYTVTPTNTGSLAATTVSCAITLDASLTFVSAVGTGWTCGAVGQVVTCTRASMPTGAAITIAIVATTTNTTASITSSGSMSAANATTATSGNDTTQVNAVTRDATSGWYFPATIAEMDTVLLQAGLATGSATNIYLCQEASGNLAGTGGGLTLTANGTPLYQQAMTGHTRKGVGFSAAANQRFTAASGAGPSPATTSQLWMWVGELTAVGSASTIITSVSDGATNYRMIETATPRVQCAIAGVGTTGSSDPTAVAVQMYAILYDRTNSRAICLTGQEVITGTYSSGVVDGRKGIGGVTSPTGRICYGVEFQSAAAELTNNQIKAIAQTCGWTISW